MAFPSASPIPEGLWCPVKSAHHSGDGAPQSAQYCEAKREQATGGIGLSRSSPEFPPSRASLLSFKAVCLNCAHFLIEKKGRTFNISDASRSCGALCFQVLAANIAVTSSIASNTPFGYPVPFLEMPIPKDIHADYLGWNKRGLSTRLFQCRDRLLLWHRIKLEVPRREEQARQALAEAGRTLWGWEVLSSKCGN